LPAAEAACVPRCEHRVWRDGLPLPDLATERSDRRDGCRLSAAARHKAAHLASQAPSGPRAHPRFRGPSLDRAADAADPSVAGRAASLPATARGR